MITYFQTNLKRNLQNGQALALILLVMSAVLVVGLSVASRSITSQSTSTQTERSQQAFNAAEAGIQEALRRDPKDFSSAQALNFNGVTVNITSKPINELPFLALKDQVTQIKLDNVGSGGLTFDWGKSSEAEADLELIFINGNTGNLTKKYCDVGGATSSTISSADGDCTFSASSSGFNHTVTIPNGSLLAQSSLVRIIPRYQNTTMKVTGNSIDTADAGFLIESTATTPDGIVRKVQANTTTLAVDQVFDYSLFSGAGL